MSLTANSPQTPPPLPALTFWKKVRLWLSMIFIDHSFFRVWFNLPSKVGNGLYRSSHPMPYQLRNAQRKGIKSILNLRGVDDNIASNVLERATCLELGLPLVHLPIYSRAAPKVEEVLGLKKVFETLPKPILLHCKSGADRAGMGSALYLLLQENASPEVAAKQLCFWPHGHVRQAKTGMLDHFVDTFAAYHKEHGTSFLDWLTKHYDRNAVESSFQAKGWANRLVDGLLKRE